MAGPIQTTDYTGAISNRDYDYEYDYDSRVGQVGRSKIAEMHPTPSTPGGKA
jgi:hypothetical protein